MIVLKEKNKAKNGVLHMNLPDEFKDKTVEVVVSVGSEVARKLLTDTVKIDTTRWKFSRDDIYGK